MDAGTVVLSSWNGRFHIKLKKFVLDAMFGEDDFTLNIHYVVQGSRPCAGKLRNIFQPDLKAGEHLGLVLHFLLLQLHLVDTV